MHPVGSYCTVLFLDSVHSLDIQRIGKFRKQNRVTKRRTLLKIKAMETTPPLQKNVSIKIKAMETAPPPPKIFRYISYYLFSKHFLMVLHYRRKCFYFTLWQELIFKYSLVFTGSGKMLKTYFSCC